MHVFAVEYYKSGETARRADRNRASDRSSSVILAFFELHGESRETASTSLISLPVLSNSEEAWLAFGGSRAPNSQQKEMPVHRRSSENQEDSPSSPIQQKQQEEEEEEEEQTAPPPLPPHHDDDIDDCDDNGDDDDDEDSQGIPSSTGDKDEFILVKLSDIRKEVQCPICLGIIRKTRTVMECLHRFCRECIDKSMRLGNNECPACRTHCASRRSLRDDPNYDALIASIYPDIDKYEEEELAFHEEEKNRNKQIQASIAQTLRRQFGRRRTMAKATAAAFVRKAQGGYRSGTQTQQNSSGYLRGKSRTGGATVAAAEASDDDDEDAEGGGAKDSSSTAGCDENDGDDLVDIRESTGASPGGGRGNREVLVWGKGGVRSHTRYGTSGSGGTNGKNTRSSSICGRVSKLLEYLHNRSLEENNDEFDIHCTFRPWDAESTPSLQQSYLCCRPTVSISHLCRFIALQISVQVEDLEILVRKPKPAIFGLELCASTSTSPGYKHDPPKEEEELEILGDGETLAGINTCYAAHRGELVLVYRIKSSGTME